MNRESNRPRAVSGGWAFGRSILPSPRDQALLWRVLNDIMVHRETGVLILAHHNADLDAVGSAIVLKRAFPWVDLGAYRSISAPAKNLLSRLDMKMDVDPDVSGYSLVIIVDSSSPLQVSEGDVSGWPRYWVVDHHPDHNHWEGGIYVDQDRSACVEIALQMALLSGCGIDSVMAISGIAGIVADTGKFRFSKPGDFQSVGFLLEGSDVNMEVVLGIIEGDDYFDVSKKLAQLKALRRVRYERVGDQIVATSKVASFEAAAARALLVVGADVVFIGARKRDEIRISTRAKPHIIRSGVHLGHFMEMIGKETGNQGGGHEGAAGLNGKGDIGRALDMCMKRMVSTIREKEEKALIRNGSRVR